MQNELEDNLEEYNYLTHEDWCDLLSTIKVKDNRKRSANHIKKIASARAASNHDSDESIRFPRNKKSSTGVLHNNINIKATKHHGTQRHFVIYKKTGMPERKYMLHSAEDQQEVHQGQTGAAYGK